MPEIHKFNTKATFGLGEEMLYAVFLKCENAYVESFLKHRTIFDLSHFVAFEEVVHEFILQLALVYFDDLLAVSLQQANDLSIFFLCHN